MKNRKAQTLAINKIIVLVLILLVVVLVLVAVFKLDIQKWLNFLPSFGTQTGSTKYVDKCPVKVAEIKEDMIFFCNQETKVCDIPSKLQIDKNNMQVHNSNIIIPDINVGQVTVNLIIIFKDIISRNIKLYSSVAKDLPDYYYMLNLNGAYLHSKTEICRDEIVHEEKIEYSPEEKIGTLGYGGSSSGWKIWQLSKSVYYKINSKEKIFSYNGITGETYSNLFIEENKIYFDKLGFNNVPVGVRSIDNKIISVYSQYLSDEPSGVNPKGFLIELNGSKIVAGEIYKKK